MSILGTRSNHLLTVLAVFFQCETILSGSGYANAVPSGATALEAVAQGGNVTVGQPDAHALIDIEPFHLVLYQGQGIPGPA